MKYLIVLTIYFLLGTSIAQGQKKILTFQALKDWPSIISPKINNNGKYVTYHITTPAGSNLLVVRSTENFWEKEFQNCTDECFIEGGSKFIFKNASDSLGILDLNTKSFAYIPQVLTYKIADQDTGLAFIAYISKDTDHNGLTVQNSSGAILHKFADVSDYQFDHTHKILLVKQQDKHTKIHSLIWLNLNNGKSSIISHEPITSNYQFDFSASQLCFFGQRDANDNKSTRLKYYKTGLDTAIDLVTGNTPGAYGMVPGDGDIIFSKTGNRVFFNMTIPEDNTGKSGNKNQAEIYDYKNFNYNLIDHEYRKNFLATVNTDLAHTSFLQLEHNHGHGSMYDAGDYVSNNGDYVVSVTPVKRDAISYYSGSNFHRDLTLISVNTGERTVICKNVPFRVDPSLSPGGNYFIWWDWKQKCWLCYNLINKAITNLTNKIHSVFSRKDDDSRIVGSCGIAGWLKNDRAVLLYDQHDIWEIDPTGHVPPVNITHYYGKKNHIQLRIIDFGNPDAINKCSIMPAFQELYLSGLDLATKGNRFFSLTLDKTCSLKKLARIKGMIYPGSGVGGAILHGVSVPMLPLKAKDTNVFLVSRMDYNEYPNLSVTTDFKDFKSLSDMAPQNDFAWYTNELVHWKTKNGRRMTGLLYKPENFNPSKKYPVICDYYEKNSVALHYFISPILATGPLNIPWLVNHGYLVFVPDFITFKVGYPGRSVCDIIESAVDYLSTKSWIDSKKIGITGHSHGGWETDYLVTHSRRFAAAMAADGATDLIRASADYSTGPWSSYYETGQGRIGEPYWRNPSLYIENSPVFKVDSVTTPLLIVHGKHDDAVPFHQGEEFFNALVRANKKVWLLSYSDMEHYLYPEQVEEEEDLTLRSTQFFNHYLKGEDAPEWMTKGTTSLALDPTGKP